MFLRNILKFRILILALPLLLLFSTTTATSKGNKSNSFVNSGFHSSYIPTFKSDAKDGEVRNIILMIGDGMGLAHLSSAMYANKGVLTITNLKSIGFVRTQSANSFTTDSAASGTAYATGNKTNNSIIGLDVNGEEIKNIPEIVAPLGYATGVITTDYIDGATPSAFYAHQQKRSMSTEILGDLPNSPLLLIVGGTKEHIEKNRPQLWEEFAQSGFTVIENTSNLNINTVERVALIPSSKSTNTADKPKRGEFLPEATEFGIEFLDSKPGKGFFMMVEGARIDWAGHGNNFSGVILETLDFDKAVEVAIRFADEDGKTLVIISADHETGGLSLDQKGNIENGELGGSFAYKRHTPIMVPLFAYGPKSHLFMGVQENSDVANKIIKIMSHQCTKNECAEKSEEEGK